MDYKFQQNSSHILFLFFSRTIQMLQKLGKADETRDELFEHYVHNFNSQQAAANRLYKELQNYVKCVRGGY